MPSWLRHVPWQAGTGLSWGRMVHQAAHLRDAMPHGASPPPAGDSLPGTGVKVLWQHLPVGDRKAGAQKCWLGHIWGVSFVICR